MHLYDKSFFFLNLILVLTVCSVMYDNPSLNEFNGHLRKCHPCTLSLKG